MTVAAWDALCAPLIRCFSPLNIELAAPDKLHSWRQTKDVGTFNESFLSVLFHIPDITMAEKIDRYIRGLTRDTWQTLFIKT